MTTSDALIVGEDFISEHYFSTDAKSESFQAKVLDRRKEWDAAKEAGHPTPRSQYSEERGALAKDFNGLSENSDADVLDALYKRLRTLLGYDSTVRWDTHRLGDSKTHAGPVISFRARDLTGAAPLVIVEARGDLALEDILAKDEKTLLRGFFEDEAEEIESVARLLSQLFVADDGPHFALVLAGGLALVTERERWLEGRYLAVDLQLVGERNDDKRGGEIDRALTCSAADSLAPDAEGNIWWSGILDESIKHTVGRIAGSARGRPAVDRDHRQRSGRPSTSRAVWNRSPQTRHSPSPDSPCASCTASCFCSTPKPRPSSRVLPVGADEYDEGYGLDRLRELTLVELAGPRAQSGTHIYESLARCSDLWTRATPGAASRRMSPVPRLKAFNRALRADLFLPTATALIDEVGLGNAGTAAGAAPSAAQ